MSAPIPVDPIAFHRCFESMRVINITATFTLEFTASETPDQVRSVPVVRQFTMHVLSDAEHSAIMIAIQHAETTLRGDLALEHAGQAVDIAALAITATATEMPIAHLLLGEDCLEEIEMATNAVTELPAPPASKPAVN